MMKRFFPRLTAAFLFLGSIIGLLFSIAIIALVFPIRAKLVVGLDESLALTHKGLTTTSNILTTIDNTLTKVDGSLTVLVDSARDTSASLKTTSEMATSIASLVGDSFTAVIDKTQSSLDVAGKTARIVDDTLALIAAVPIIGARYEPENTLEDSINGISTSLDPMTTNLGEVRDDLKQTAEDLGGIRSSLDTLADSLEDILGSVEDTQKSTQEYIATVNTLIDKVEFIQKNFRTWLTILSILAILFFLWMAAAQVGMMMQAKALWVGYPKELVEIRHAVEGKEIKNEPIEKDPSQPQTDLAEKKSETSEQTKGT
jgi:archaellum component FlaC